MSRRLLAVAALLFGGCANLPPDRIERTLDGKPVTIRVIGFESERPVAPPGPAEPLPETYDAIIVGGGPSGLTAAWYLRDRKILLLERADVAGGLAHRATTPEGVVYGRGAAYCAMPGGAMEDVFRELGLLPLEDAAIPEPIDSLWQDGGLLKEVWSEETLRQLPPGFRRFKEALLELERQDRLPDLPLEEADDLALDRQSAAEFIKPFGPELKAFLDSYGRSALGATTDELSALVFCFFYISEFDVRYGWPGGLGEASRRMIERLTGANPSALRTGAAVTRVRNVGGGVEVDFADASGNRRARARCAILAVPLRVAAWIVEGYPDDRRALVENLKYADYVVHNVFTRRDLHRDSYDTWLVGRRITDFIAARWIETRGFSQPAAPGPGVLALYQPLPPSGAARRLDPDAVAAMAIEALRDLRDAVPDLAREPRLDVESVRWPASLHVAAPGYVSTVAPRLKAPIGRIHFAGNNLGTPCFEEALYRGWRAARDVRPLLSRAFPHSDGACQRNTAESSAKSPKIATPPARLPIASAVP